MTALEESRRLVIKIGSSILVDETKGEIRRDWLESLTDAVARLHKGGCEIVLVSSGAIRLGRTHFKLPPGPLKLEESQAAAATGQIQLAHAYQEALARHGITVAQVLLTLDDSEARRRYLNARQTMGTLLGLGALIDNHARCTWFLPEASPLSARKKWIKGSLKTAGTLTVDDGAMRALSSGKSLLPAGVTEVAGDFRRGDVVDVRDRGGRMLARGLVAYAAEDARRIAGRKSAEIERLLGFRGRDEIVHRDDLVVD